MWESSTPSSSNSYWACGTHTCDMWGTREGMLEIVATHLTMLSKPSLEVTPEATSFLRHSKRDKGRGKGLFSCWVLLRPLSFPINCPCRCPLRLFSGPSSHRESWELVRGRSMQYLSSMGAGGREYQQSQIYYNNTYYNNKSYIAKSILWYFAPQSSRANFFPFESELDLGLTSE